MCTDRDPGACESPKARDASALQGPFAPGEAEIPAGDAMGPIHGASRLQGHFHPRQGDGHTHSHAHSHTHTQTKNVLNRLNRAIGHLESVRRMVEDGRDCAEVLVQLAAVRAALGNTGKLIIKDHIEHCVVEAVEYNDQAAIQALIHAIEGFI